MENNKEFQDIYNKKIEAQPVPNPEIGIDIEDSVLFNLIGEGQSTHKDLATIESLFTISQNRNTIYDMLDTMSEDSLISAALEIYAEDSTETNDSGRIVWVESADNNISKYVQFLLDSMNVDKNIYKWVYSLCKYGDLYLRLYRESEFDQDLLNRSKLRSQKDTQKLEETVKIKAFSENDKYVHYLEMVPNPAEMFELTRFGRTSSYIKAPTSVTKTAQQGVFNSYYKYQFNKRDVEIYQPTTFVHACLEDNVSRTPEQIELFKEDGDVDSGELYTVRRGQSLLYNSFKIWRELSLLENTLLLNRLTKSSIVRIIGVEVANMPKEQVGPHLNGIKNLIEQRTALDSGSSLTEYTNPGPMENNIYVPTRNGQGAISTQQVGGDVNIKDIVDIDYFKDKLTGNLRIPKQYLGDTDDATGFNGGTSLSLVSSRYAKAIKRIQNTVVQCLTDAINLILLDKGYKGYINRFTIKMLPPTTQEEVDRRNSMDSRIGIVNNIMMLLDPIEDPAARLKILKSLLSEVVPNTEMMNVIEEQIEKMEAEQPESVDDTEDFDGGGSFMDASMETGGNDGFSDVEDFGDEFTAEEPINTSEETILPSPADLGMDLTNNTNQPE